MRLWCLHPGYLDPKGLVALWREALLAQKVLRGETKGYRHHPQLNRFREPDCRGIIQAYLLGVYREAKLRGYRFNRKLIDWANVSDRRPRITTGQLVFERQLLANKLDQRCSEGRFSLQQSMPMMHEAFWLARGPKADWEKQ